jgi:hypothetical protein
MHNGALCTRPKTNAKLLKLKDYRFWHEICKRPPQQHNNQEVSKMNIQGQPIFKLMLLCLAVPMFIACPSPQDIGEQACRGLKRHLQENPEDVEDIVRCITEGGYQG